MRRLGGRRRLGWLELVLGLIFVIVIVIHSIHNLHPARFRLRNRTGDRFGGWVDAIANIASTTTTAIATTAMATTIVVGAAVVADIAIAVVAVVAVAAAVVTSGTLSVAPAATVGMVDEVGRRKALQPTERGLDNDGQGGLRAITQHFRIIRTLELSFDTITALKELPDNMIGQKPPCTTLQTQLLHLQDLAEHHLVAARIGALEDAVVDVRHHIAQRAHHVALAVHFVEPSRLKEFDERRQCRGRDEAAGFRRAHHIQERRQHPAQVVLIVPGGFGSPSPQVECFHQFRTAMGTLWLERASSPLAVPAHNSQHRLNLADDEP